MRTRAVVNPNETINTMIERVIRVKRRNLQYEN